MDLHKILRYIEVLQIAIVLTLSFYMAPLRFILGQYQESITAVLISAALWFLMSRHNDTFIALIEKWKKDDK